MKKKLLLLSFCVFLIGAENMHGQSAPEWTVNLNELSDSSNLLPVRTIVNTNLEVIVLTSYQNSNGPSVVNKIQIYKYDRFGNQVWKRIYDHGGVGNPRAFDMVLDNSDNIYIAGGLMASTNYQPLLLKMNTGGTIQWEKISFTFFTTGYLNKLLLQNNKLFIAGTSGIANCTLGGIEIWSNDLQPNEIAIDQSDRMVVNAFSNPNYNLIRFNSTGTIDLLANSLYYGKVATDDSSNIYVLNDDQTYQLEKINSVGQLQWSYTDLPPSPPFGDISYDILFDYDQNIHLIGLNDTIVKLTRNGNLIWKKPMNGIDNYLIKAQFIGNDVLAVAGTIQGFAGWDQIVSTFDRNGNVSWTGTYSSNFYQELSVDLTVDYSGLYVLEDSAGSTGLMKYQSPFTLPPDFNNMCVDSVWYDANDPNRINVTVFNGNTSQLNYPSVQIISPTGDTIGNPQNRVDFFAHLGNIYLTYNDTITVTGITNWSQYTFLMHDGFGTTSGTIELCFISSITVPEVDNFVLYPNPTTTDVYLNGKTEQIVRLDLYDTIGKQIFSQSEFTSEQISIPTSSLKSGIYFLNIQTQKSKQTIKLIKQ